MRTTKRHQESGVPIRNGLVAEYKFEESRNLLKYSQQFDNAAWGKGYTAISPNATTAPDGTLTADKLKLDSTNGVYHLMNTDLTIPLEAKPYCYSIYLKKSEVSWIRMTAISQGDQYHSWCFNLDTNVIGAPNTALSASMVDAGNGWYRCSINLCPSAAGGTYFYLYLMKGDTDDFILLGDGTSGVYIWGAQVEAVPQTTKNLLKFTEQANNAVWTKTNHTVTANATTAPDGSLTADKLVSSVDAESTAHNFQQTIVTQANTPYRFSVYAKAAEVKWIFLLFWGTTTPATQCYFDLENGVLGDPINTTPSIQSVGNGWYRCSITITTTTGEALPIIAGMYSSGVNNYVYQGDGEAGLYIWGAQLELGIAATPYEVHPFPGGATTYVPTTDKQTLMDYSKPRRNLLMPNQANGGEDGTTVGFSESGATPATVTSSTDWAYIGSRSIKVVTAGDGTDEGVCVNLTPVKPSTTYTASVVLKGGGTCRLILQEYTEAIGFVDSTIGESITLTGTPTKHSITRAFGTTGRLAYIRIHCDPADDITFYADCYQLEEGAAATAWEAPPNIGMLGSATGADTNDPTWTGQGVHGIDDDYIQLPPLVASAITTFTVMVVAYPDDVTSNDYFISLGGDSDTILKGFDNGFWNVYAYAPAQESMQVAATVAWQCLAYTFQGTGIERGYLNGSLVTSATRGATMQLYAPKIFDSTAADYFNGSIAYLLFYNRALTDAEITKNYAYLKSYLKKERGVALP